MFRLDFESPAYLILLAALPLMWWISMRTLSGMGMIRRLTAIGLRTIVFTLLVAALAEMQWVRVADRLTVIYLLDQSLSISPQQTDLMIDYINKSIESQRDSKRQDRAGVIVFGREGAIEMPPIDEHQRMRRVETLIDRENTNLEGAMKLAQASFPHDTAKRLVIISDFNQTMGNAIEQARTLAAAGIGIYVVPVRSVSQGEVAVEKVMIPPDMRRGQPFELRVVVNNIPAAGREPAPVVGKLQVVRKTGERVTPLVEDTITVPPGKHVYGFKEELTQAEFYTYEAKFIPLNAGDDTMPQNNQATAFTHIRGSGQVLVLENHEQGDTGEFDFMVEKLRSMNLEVTLKSTKPENLFTDLTQLQPYDTIVLANVPREHFSDEQVDILVRNTQNLGSGLIMLGGPNSFGAGGWTNTPMEEAMPVDFQIKNAKVKPIGALAMVMHASELPQGNYWQTLVAQQALSALGDEDYCGVIQWDMSERWLWRNMSRVGPNRRNMMAQLDRMTPGDMPDFEPSLKMAQIEFGKLGDAAVKHMILISDGDPSQPDFGPRGALAALAKMGVKVSTVAIGTHGPPGSTPLQKIATMTGGKYYVVNNAQQLPKIYQKEARRVAKPLVFERDAPFTPQVIYPHEMLSGITQLPPITGFVLTQPKDNPLVEVEVVSPLPEGNDVNPILASWTYGLGKTAVLTTDAGKRWATAWTEWDNYDKFYSQMVRWSMRPSGDTGKYTVSTDVKDGRVRVVVTALDKEDKFLDFLTPRSTVVGPDMKPIDLDVRQVAPGRYVGEFDAPKTGSYMVLVSPTAGQSPLRSGVSIPYSDEFRERETNDALLESLAKVVPTGGVEGLVVDAPLELEPDKRLTKLLETNVYGHDLPPARSGQAVWHWLVLAASCLFFADVFVRRVSINFDWLPPLLVEMRDQLLGRQRTAPVEQTMERLRSRKAEVSDELEQRRAALRFEPTPDAPADLAALDEASDKPAHPPTTKTPTSAAPQASEDDYTARLLKAKKKARDEQRRDSGDGPT